MDYKPLLAPNRRSMPTAGAALQNTDWYQLSETPVARRPSDEKRR